MYLKFLLIAVILFVADADQCLWGKFGDNCERNCSCNCAVLKNKTAKHCNKISGECSEGCIPEWYGPDCKTQCSENCLKNICNQHNGHCSQGCKENYTGILCNISKDFSNSDACKCDPSEHHLVVALASCLGPSLLLNVIGAVGWCLVCFKRRQKRCKEERNKHQESETLNPEPPIMLQNVFTTQHVLFTDRNTTFLEYMPTPSSVCISSILASPNCKNCLFGKCDQDGICTDGCEPGFADVYCQHSCQETCAKGRCIVDNRTGTTMCTEGCVDGFCYPACKIPCPEGCLRCKRMLCENCTLCESHLYGENCQHSCVDKCNGYECSMQGNCSQDRCMDGRYGKFCSSSCKPRYESCDRKSGHCIKCRRGVFGDDCQNQCPQECMSMEEDFMFKCRSGCKLCKISTQRESKQDLDCADMQATLTTTNGLCIALIVIAVTSLCLNIRNAWQLKRGRHGNVANTRLYLNRTSSGHTNRSLERDSGAVYFDAIGQSVQGIPGTDGEQSSQQLQDDNDRS